MSESSGTAAHQLRHGVRGKGGDIDPGWADARDHGRALAQTFVPKGGRQKKGDLAHAAGEGEDGIGLVMEQDKGAAGKARTVDRARVQALLQADQPFPKVGMGERIGLADMLDDLRVRRDLESRLCQIDQPGQGRRLTSGPTAYDDGEPVIVTEWMM
jgi:hypothetical protein